MFRKRQKKRFLCRKNVRVWHRFRDLVKIFRISDEISKGRHGINAISRENFRVNLVGFSLRATGTHSQNYLIE